ncbi:MAG: ankyrin repeat domain-containing protein [Acetatifactor sp.]|nr:ankyrin repeat domain-containing protein [Acetatifactor sp.]
MYNEIFNQIEWCFDWRTDPANCFGAPAKMEEIGFWDEIDLNDDDDLAAMIRLGLRAMQFSMDREKEPNADFIKYLISKGFDINTTVPGGECILLQAVNKHLSPLMIQKLVELGADPCAENSSGDNILIQAAKQEYDAEEEEEKGAMGIYVVEHFDQVPLDTPDRYGITPLMYAAMFNHILLAKALIAHGSDVNAAGTQPIGGNSYWIKMEGVTPLALACRSGSVEIAKLLLEAGADETLRDAKGKAPIFSLLRYPHNFRINSRIDDPIYGRKCEILSLLKELELTDEDGYTALMRSMQDSKDPFDEASAYSNNLPITQALIKQGANVEATGNDGRRPLHLAVQALGDVHKSLIKAGAELNVQDSDGNTPLLIACQRCDETIVRYLIKAGADVTIQNNKGKTAMELCSERGFNSAIELMMGQM